MTLVTRPVTGGGGEAFPKKFFSPWKNVLDTVNKLGPLSENSSPPLVCQAGYGPSSDVICLWSHFDRIAYRTAESQYLLLFMDEAVLISIYGLTSPRATEKNPT